MILKNFNEISTEDVISAIDRNPGESLTLEYKRWKPILQVSDKHEFLADVTAFANSSGGDIIYGVDDKDKNIVGIGGFDEDKDCQAIENYFRDLIDPRLIGHQMKVLKCGDNKILIIRIPKSWNGPHMLKTRQVFYIRNNSGKHPMNVTEIRSAFEFSAGLSERIRQWRDTRLGNIIANQVPTRLHDGPKLVLHMIPLESLADAWKFPVSDIEKQQLKPIGYGQEWIDKRINLDGVIFDRVRDDKTSILGYVQAFRSGCIESIRLNVINNKTGNNGLQYNVFHGLHHETQIIRSAKDYLLYLKNIGVQPPIVCLMALIHFKNIYMYTNEAFIFPSPEQHPIDRDTLLLPDVIIKDYSDDLPAVFKPIFDAIWNASGISGSRNYTDGVWKPQQ